jgi:hypothetical protein
MEIQSLKLFLTDADVVTLAQHALRDGDEIDELAVRLTPEGVRLSGQYPTGFFKVPFETLWQVRAAGPEIHVRLASVTVAGLPGGMLNGMLLKMARDALEGEAGVRVEDDVIIVHVSEAVRSRGIDLLVRFAAVRLSIGAAVIEAD